MLKGEMKESSDSGRTVTINNFTASPTGLAWKLRHKLSMQSIQLDRGTKKGVTDVGVLISCAQKSGRTSDDEWRAQVEKRRSGGQFPSSRTKRRKSREERLCLGKKTREGPLTRNMERKGSGRREGESLFLKRTKGEVHAFILGEKDQPGKSH